MGGEEGGVWQFTCEGEWTNEVVVLSLPLVSCCNTHQCHISTPSTPASPLHPSPSLPTRSAGECRLHSNTTFSSVLGRERAKGREGRREGGLHTLTSELLFLQQPEGSHWGEIHHFTKCSAKSSIITYTLTLRLCSEQRVDLMRDTCTSHMDMVLVWPLMNHYVQPPHACYELM